MVVVLRKISGLYCEIVIAGGFTSVDSKSDKITRGSTLCSNPQLFSLEVFGSLAPALTNFMYKNLVLEI